MPIYEYYSPDTHKIYAFLVRSTDAADRLPFCPDGEAHRMERVMSGFAVTGRAREENEGSGEGGMEDDPRMEAAMAEMEKEMASMDEDNPDPRRMGQLMRRMADMTGEKMPEPMEEMMRRLEGGEDPDKLEEEFGDLSELDDLGEGGSDEDGGESGPGPEFGSSRLRALLRRQREPARDPQLYEFSDYIPA